MYSAVLNTLFSRSMLRSCIANEPCKNYLYAANTFLRDATTKTNEVAIRELYELLLKTHRNEYVYKNTLLNRIVMGRHSPRTSTAFTEVPIGDSIADFLIINGKATVYEIKTDLDYSGSGFLDSRLEVHRETPYSGAVSHGEHSDTLTPRAVVEAQVVTCLFALTLDREVLYEVLRLVGTQAGDDALYPELTRKGPVRQDAEVVLRRPDELAALREQHVPHRVYDRGLARAVLPDQGVQPRMEANLQTGLPVDRFELPEVVEPQLGNVHVTILPTTRLILPLWWSGPDVALVGTARLVGDGLNEPPAVDEGLDYILAKVASRTQPKMSLYL